MLWLRHSMRTSGRNWISKSRKIGFGIRNVSQTSGYDSLAELPNEADAVVIGGGSIGCSTLYHLAKFGVKNAVLLERHKLTSGTTWHTAGIYWSLRPSDIDIELLAYSKKLVSEILPKEADMDCGWINNGGLFVASTKERLDEYKRLLTIGRVYGIESHVLDPNETKRLYPIMNVEDVYGTLYSPGDGLIDPSSWCGALTKAARKYGAKVFEHCPVTEIVASDDHTGARRVTGVRTATGALIKTPLVVNCAGAWAPKLTEPLGIHLPTMAMQHAYVITEKIGDHVRKLPNVRDHDSAMYIRLQGDALAFGGYEANPVYWEDVRDDFVFGLFDLDWERFGVHVEGACNRVPVLRTTGIKSQVCGPMSFTVDHKPLMGETPEVRGLFLACGMELGMMMGGALGRQTALWAVRGRPDLHLYGYDVRRFNPKLSPKYHWVKEKLHEAVYTMYKIHWPKDEPLAGRNQIKTPFHQALLEDGCVFQERHGWERAGWFATDEMGGERIAPILPYDHYGAYGPEKTPKHENYTYEKRLTNDYSWNFPSHHDLIGRECQTVRNKVGVFDMSYFGKFYITGKDAQKAVDFIFSNDLHTKPVGSTVYTCMLNASGGVESDLTVSIIDKGDGSTCAPAWTDGTDKSFYVAAGGGSQTHSLAHIRNLIADHKFDVQLDNRTEDMGILSVQGPNSRRLLQSLTKSDLSDSALPFSHHAVVKIADHACRILRLSFVGELGYELHVPRESCMPVYRALHKAGQTFGLRNVGYRALESLSAEKGYRFWDSDLRFTDTPLEASMAYTCKLKSNVDFYGRQALEKQKKEGVRKKIACFTLDSQTPLWSLEAIYRNGVPIGFIRRAEYAYVLGKSIAYGYLKRPDGGVVKNDWIESGQYEIEALGERYSAVVHLKSPFDPDNNRIKGQY